MIRIPGRFGSMGASLRLSLAEPPDFCCFHGESGALLMQLPGYLPWLLLRRWFFASKTRLPP